MSSPTSLPSSNGVDVQHVQFVSVVHNLQYPSRSNQNILEEGRSSVSYCKTQDLRYTEPLSLVPGPSQSVANADFGTSSASGSNTAAGVANRRHKLATCLRGVATIFRAFKIVRAPRQENPTQLS